MDTGKDLLEARRDDLTDRYQRRSVRPGDLARGALAGLPDLTPQVSRSPAMSPTSRKIDRSFRIQLKVEGLDIGDYLGWRVGPLESSVDGAWLVLGPGVSEGGCALVDSGRLRLDAAARWRLSVGSGDEVLVLPVPERGVLAVCNPALVLAHAPLSILEVAGVG